MAIELVGVVGCGVMGAGIAEVCARAGLDVTVCDLDTDSIDEGRLAIAASMEKAVGAGKLAPELRDEALGRLTFTTDLNGLGDREIVVEAIIENETQKLELFCALDRLVGRSTILASNTSSIPIMKLAMATRRPDRVVGMHFFNPVPVLRLVELVPSLRTSATTVECAEELAKHRLGKHVIRSKDRAGFVVNALLVPYVLSAIRMVESGFAGVDDIDTGMVIGCSHPMGPLALADLIGLDTVRAVAESLYAEFREPAYAPPPLLTRMVEAGLLGRKTSQGFYPYDS
jgi:3-hydroxybutyryl-CoA dehydrogenase